MKKIKRALSLVLVFCMLCTMTVTGFAADTASEGQTDFMKIVHLDAGRKYFSVDSIKKIIDNASADGYNYLELAVGNDGLRFLLDDMSVTVNGTTYKSDKVSNAIHAGNEAYYNFDTDELMQSEMDTIIAYANKKGISIIPLINSPGHMDAILSAANSLTGTTCSYNGSARTIDVTNTTAVTFTQALIQKYVNYFAGKGCKYFNMGADEYANDKYTSGSMGFGQLQTEGSYDKFVTYVNQMATMIENAGMTPMAFNDGIYFNNNTSSGTFDTGIVISYWSSGWSGYTPMSASELASMGFKLINTHGSYYWVLGKSDWQCSAEKASEFNYKEFQHKELESGTIDNPAGAMFCIWCDYPGADTEANVVSNTADTMAAFAKTLPSASNSSDSSSGAKPSKAPTADSTDSTADQTVTVSVGGTKTVTVSGDQTNNVNKDSLDTSIATVAAKYNNGSESTLKEVTSIESGKPYLIVNNRTTQLLTNASSTWSNHQGLKLDGTASTGSTALWTITGSGSSYTVQDTSGNYLTIGNNTASVSGTSATLSLEYKDSSYWTISQTSQGSRRGTTYYLNNLGGGTTAGGYTSVDAGSKWTLYEIASETQGATTLTFTGVKKGTTTVKVGSATYTINVVEQAPDDALTDTSLTMEYWITNRVVTADNATSKTITTDTENISTEAGAKLSDIAPSTGTYDSNEMVYWKGTRLSSDNKQTTGSDVDRTRSGDDFSYIRNYKGWWQISADGSQWKDVKETDQIVVYYLQKTTVTDEIETQVVDWGVTPHKNYTDDIDTATGKQSFVLVDYAVKYQSGDRSPDSFPTDKTQAFHCHSGTSTVQYDDSAKAYYRHIGMIRAQETSDYEVYMITLTPSNDNAQTAVAQTTAKATSYSYDGTEKVVWVDDAKDLGDFADSSTHHKDYSVGGDPIVSGLDIYNQQGMLVTYYVRAKVTEDNLKVHYIDKATNTQFYNYNIVVKNGTTFDENIALNADAWKGNLDNGTVTNSLNVKQTVSADLSTMPEIGAKYRYSNYKCDAVTRSEDGKDVYLYYTFNNSHSFVADFGKPITISAADLGISEGAYTWTSSTVTGAKYGEVTLDTEKHTLTYTPNQILKDVDTLQLTLKEQSSDNNPATHNIYIYPASNVMYEENFVKLGDNSSWTTTGKAGTSTQATEVLGKEGIHGYDTSYDTDSEFSNGSAYKATLTLENGEEFVKTQDKATFTFTGTGFDLISECGTDTGIVSVVVKDANGSTVKAYLVDTYFTGDTDKIISGTGVLDYQVPIVRCTGLKQGTYTVETRGYLTSGSGAVAKTAEETTGEDEEVSEETVAEVLDDLNVKNVDASEVEATCMDDNSVLLGGTGAEATTTSTKSKARAAAAKTTSTIANVYIDGVRVYKTLNDSNGAQNYIDSEKNVKYESVYDYVKNSLDENEDDAAVYVEYDGNQDVWNIADYKQQGPENEVYLTPGNSIAIALDGYKTGDTVQIAAKAINGEVSCDGLEKTSLSTATEMYYTAEVVGDDDSAYVQITNNKDSKGVLALSEMKVSSGINAIADPELKEEVLDKLNHKADFVPETLTVSAPETLVKGHLSTLSVKASASDVKEVYLSLDNGEAEKLEANNSKAVKRGKSKTYSYSVAINSEDELSVGEHEYSVYAVSKDGGKKSDPVVATVTVKKAN